MPSYKSIVVAVAALFVVTTQADYSIDPNTVPLATRKSWCNDQTSSCPIICGDVSAKPVEVNNCDPQALRYGCLCGDGKQPNISQYSLTLPYHVCQEFGNQCVKACGLGANSCANDCRTQNPCGAQNPTRVNSTSAGPTTSVSATNSPNAVFTGISGASTGSGSGSGSGASTLETGRGVGLAVLIAGVIGGVALLL